MSHSRVKQERFRASGSSVTLASRHKCWDSRRTECWAMTTAPSRSPSRPSRLTRKSVCQRPKANLALVEAIAVGRWRFYGMERPFRSESRHSDTKSAKRANRRSSRAWLEIWLRGSTNRLKRKKKNCVESVLGSSGRMWDDDRLFFKRANGVQSENLKIWIAW